MKYEISRKKIFFLLDSIRNSPKATRKECIIPGESYVDDFWRGRHQRHPEQSKSHPSFQLAATSTASACSSFNGEKRVAAPRSCLT